MAFLQDILAASNAIKAAKRQRYVKKLARADENCLRQKIATAVERGRTEFYIDFRPTWRERALLSVFGLAPQNWPDAWPVPADDPLNQQIARIKKILADLGTFAVLPVVEHQSALNNPGYTFLRLIIRIPA